MDDEAAARRERLGSPLATIELTDCIVTFRRQQGTGDIWSVATGPLGTLTFRVIERGVLRRVQAARSGRDPRRDASSRRRTRGWHKVPIEDDFLIAVRARGNRLSLAFLFGDEAAFGGGSSGLPTLRRPSLLERVQLWWSGARGEALHVSRHS